MGFVKLDTGILDSTLWIEREGREVFITALLMAEPFETLVPLETYKVREIEREPFVVPPGWYGLVKAAGQGIVRRALIDQEAGLAALERLTSPDPGSRSQKWEGRRMARVNGGYVILNFIDYRDKDNTAAERMKRFRERKARLEAERKALQAGSTPPPPPPVTRNCYGATRNQLPAEAEAEAEADINLKTPAPAAPLPGVDPVDKSAKTKRGTRLPEDWVLPKAWGEWAVQNLSMTPDRVREVAAEFKDFWIAVPGQRGCKLDWQATWRNRCREAAARDKLKGNGKKMNGVSWWATDATIEQKARDLGISGARPGEQREHVIARINAAIAQG